MCRQYDHYVVWTQRGRLYRSYAKQRDRKLRRVFLFLQLRHGEWLHPAGDGSCLRECVTDSDCPGLSYGCVDNACVFPQAGGCTDALIGVACDGPAGADGEPMAVVCFGSPLGTLCVPAATHSMSIAAPPSVRSVSHSARLVTRLLPRSVSQIPWAARHRLTVRTVWMPATAVSVFLHRSSHVQTKHFRAETVAMPLTGKPLKVPASALHHLSHV